MQIVAFLNLIRWKNVLMILFTEAVIKYALMDYYFLKSNFDYRMDNLLFALLALSSVFISSAGYIINDIVDVGNDAVNKPSRPLVRGDISVDAARKFYIGFNIIGAILAVISAFMVKNIGLASVQLFVMVLLHIYSNYLKCSKLIGNIIVSLILALVPFLIWFYSIFDIVNEGNILIYDLKWMHISVWFFMAFAFVSNLIREIIKDKEDQEADMENNCITWASSVNVSALKTIIFIMLIVLLLIILIFQCFLPKEIIFKLSLLIPQIIIIAVAFPKLLSASKPKDYKKLSTVLKLIMLGGLSSPFVLWF